MWTRKFTPPPMPEVDKATMYVDDMAEAVERIRKAWSPSQLQDALRSLRHFLDRAEVSLSESLKESNKGNS